MQQVLIVTGDSMALRLAAGTALLLMAAAWPGTVASAETAVSDAGKATPASWAEEFLTAIEGRWQGQAVVTPRGPLPYDIEFKHDENGAVKGAANPGAAIHSWCFTAQNEGLRLRFLSDFGGNTRPIILAASKRSGETLIFDAVSRDGLSVEVTPLAESMSINVLLDGDLHVRIELQR